MTNSAEFEEVSVNVGRVVGSLKGAGSPGAQMQPFSAMQQEDAARCHPRVCQQWARHPGTRVGRRQGPPPTQVGHGPRCAQSSENGTGAGLRRGGEGLEDGVGESTITGMDGAKHISSA